MPLSLEVDIGKLRLRYPTMLASGVLAVNSQLMGSLARTEGLGAIVTKSATLEARRGYENPVIAGGPCYVVNALGLPNPGYKVMSEELRLIGPALRESGVRLVASLAPSSPREAEVMAIAFEEAGAEALELNLSCPHASGLGLEVGSDPELVGELVEAVASTTSLPVLAKLGFSDRAIESAKRAEEAGATAVVAINTIRGVIIDLHARRPVLSNVYGGVSGPAIRAIAVGMVYRLYEELSIPVIGCGGVDSWESAAEMILAGASAVQVGTALMYKGLRVFREIVEGLERYLIEVGAETLKELVGAAHPK
ncbi:MAG: dihydroorotate dehydrogenase [Fervidicoccaceae archaeon]